MKTIKSFIYVLLAMLMLSTTACDYLDKEPENKMPEEGVDFTNVSNMYMPVSGMYAKLRTSGMHWAILELTVIRERDVFRDSSTARFTTTQDSTNTMIHSGLSMRYGCSITT